MKGDLHPVAFALSQRLPVRTNEAKARYLAGQDRGPKLDSTGRMTSRKGIRVNGTEYESLSVARKAVGVAFKTLHRMVEAGEAEYV